MIKFTKLQATGNDFILIDARNIKQDWPKLACDMCHRYFGVGGDGLILVTTSNIANLKMRLFNQDGSEAEVSGNGLRCFAKYVVDRKITAGPSLTVETMAGIRTIHTSLSQDKVSHAKVNMGIPLFRAEDIPVLIDKPQKGRGEVDIMPILDYPLDVGGEKLALSFVSMGNPHAVNFLSQPVADFPLSEIGPQVENHPIFPQRVNFEIARVIDRDKIEARTWERGAGETLSCGSGACAIAAIAKLKGYTNNKVDIKLTGGNLTLNWDGIGEIYLSGPVEEVFNGEWLR